MTARHHTPAYRRNARIIRQRVKGQHRLGQDATCWRGGGPIPPGMPFDVGHRDPAGGDDLGNLAAEHRVKQPGCCRGNRAEGGSAGARLVNARRATTPTTRNAQTWGL